MHIDFPVELIQPDARCAHLHIRFQQRVFGVQKSEHAHAADLDFIVIMQGEWLARFNPGFIAEDAILAEKVGNRPIDPSLRISAW